MRNRDKRERQALKRLMLRKVMTAIELGSAALDGEPVRRVEALSDLGLKIGLHFVRRGIARVDAFNRFQWVPND
ncbi:MAG: hypothetical protein JWQ89_2273 [Devosia sp.]|uniref:hypothetical protein n=1 Tax=Devosia sp. TaxID=1871048 RepID=UPI002626F63B|nr:hypothetical protein [Devosia sp.]MDB5540546.1 hypothetical protein [Devosia sp.]